MLKDKTRLINELEMFYTLSEEEVQKVNGGKDDTPKVKPKGKKELIPGNPRELQLQYMPDPEFEKFLCDRGYCDVDL